MTESMPKWVVHPDRRGPNGSPFQRCREALAAHGVAAEAGRDAGGRFLSFAVPPGLPAVEAWELTAAVADAAHPMDEEGASVSFFLFGKPEWVLREDERPVPEALRAAGDGVKGRLDQVAGAAARLVADGWGLSYGLYDLQVYHPLVRTAAQARRRLAELGIDPEAVDIWGDPDEGDAAGTAVRAAGQGAGGATPAQPR